MTRYNETADADAFIRSADSRETSVEVMRAIAFFASNGAEAEALWDGDAFGVVASLSDVVEHATGNGRVDAATLLWGGRSLESIIADA